MKQFKEYHLARIHPEGYSLILNVARSVLTAIQGGMIVEQEVFTDQECYTLAELFENYPEYCPYEVLLSVLQNDSVEKCREQIHYAIENGLFDKHIRGVRNIVSRCRIKLRPFGIEVSALIETGYILIPTQHREGKRATLARDIVPW